MNRTATLFATVALWSLMGMSALATPVRGQAAGCATAGTLQDACQKSADIFELVAPQLGVMVAGGNAVPGQYGSIGGFGHVTLGLRATGVRAHIPDLGALSARSGPAEASQIATSLKLVAVPILDANIGLFGGGAVGPVYVGALDLLISGSWMPEVDVGDVAVRASGGSFRAGFGARLELLRETSFAPAIAVTALRRSLPAASIVARTGGGDTLEVKDARVRVDSWRLTAGKSFQLLALGAGIGQDRHDASASVGARLRDAVGGGEMADELDLQQELTRTNAFVSLSLNLAPLRVTGEFGRSWGGELATFNSFDGTSPAAPRNYGSVGLLIGF